jgi:hypothetical protein
MNIERKIDANINAEVGAEYRDDVYGAGNSADVLSPANATQPQQTDKVNRNWTYSS